MLEFDKHGFLMPYGVIPCEIQVVEEYFVFNEHRAEILISFKQFIHTLNGLNINDFDIWLDGSFISLKNYPNDLDLIVFLNDVTYQRVYTSLPLLKTRFQKLDVYFVQMYPVAHPKHLFSKFDELDWLHFLTKDRKRNPKGILKLSYQT